MADAIVSLLLKNISQLLMKQAKVLSEVHGKVKSMHSRLKFIKKFLKETANRRDHDDVVRELVDQIQDVAQEAEDAIDTYVVNRLKQQQRNFIEKIYYGADNIATINKVSSQIECIMKQIDDIYKTKEILGINDFSENSDDSQSMALELKRRRTEVEEEDIVGFHNHAWQLINQLIDGRMLDAISIVGMGGLGKTTLAKKVFKHSQLKPHFPCRAWHSVSQTYNIRDVVLDLLEQVTKIPSSKADRQLDEQKLKEKLKQSLRRHKYLIMLDDIWKAEDWDKLKTCFPDDNNGSKILLTSRKIEVATYASARPPFRLPHMNKSESWALFSKRVFRGETFIPEDLVKLGKRMCKDCNGLPVAIVTLAGVLLRRTRSSHSWSEIVENVGWYLIKDPTRCLDILALSYDDLPPYLKPCFLYFGIYPEDSNIPARQIMQLWIAEGFIQNEKERNMEDLAEDYLEELIARSLIQVVSRGKDGRVKICQIHDLLRDLCAVEGARQKIFEVYKSIDDTTSSNKPRRISIHKGTPQYITSSVRREFSCTRSFLCFDSHCNLEASHWKSLCKSFKLIKVLDLGCTNVRTSMTTQIDGLVYLRYLRLSDPLEYSSPPAMSNLQHLQTIYMKGRFWKTIPDGFWKVTELRHFYVSGLPISGAPSHRSLVNLQTLTLVRANDHLKHLICSGKFPKLKMLGLEGERGRSLKNFLEQLRHLKHLQSLKIRYGKFDLPENLSYAFPLNLTKINLKHVSIEEVAIRKLKKIANFQLIKIDGIYC